MADLVLDPGINTYVTLEEAEAYIASHCESTDASRLAWNERSEDDKKILLFKSCSGLENIQYSGFKLKRGQSLQFPRRKGIGMGPGDITTWFISQSHDNSLVSGGTGDNGFEKAKEAQMVNMLAYIALKPTIVSEARTRRLSGLVGEKIGSASKSYNMQKDDIKELENGIYTKAVHNILRAWISETVFAL